MFLKLRQFFYEFRKQCSTRLRGCLVKLRKRPNKHGRMPTQSTNRVGTFWKFRKNVKEPSQNLLSHQKNSIVPEIEFSWLHKYQIKLLSQYCGQLFSITELKLGYFSTRWQKVLTIRNFDLMQHWQKMHREVRMLPLLERNFRNFFNMDPKCVNILWRHDESILSYLDIF